MRRVGSAVLHQVQLCLADECQPITQPLGRQSDRTSSEFQQIFAPARAKSRLSLLARLSGSFHAGEWRRRGRLRSGFADVAQHLSNLV